MISLLFSPEIFRSERSPFRVSVKRYSLTAYQREKAQLSSHPRVSELYHWRIIEFIRFPFSFDDKLFPASCAPTPPALEIDVPPAEWGKSNLHII